MNAMEREARKDIPLHSKPKTAKQKHNFAISTLQFIKKALSLTPENHREKTWNHSTAHTLT